MNIKIQPNLKICFWREHVNVITLYNYDIQEQTGLSCAKFSSDASLPILLPRLLFYSQNVICFVLCLGGGGGTPIESFSVTKPWLPIFYTLCFQVCPIGWDWEGAMKNVSNEVVVILTEVSNTLCFGVVDQLYR